MAHVIDCKLTSDGNIGRYLQLTTKSIFREKWFWSCTAAGLTMYLNNLKNINISLYDSQQKQLFWWGLRRMSIVHCPVVQLAVKLVFVATNSSNWNHHKSKVTFFSSKPRTMRYEIWRVNTQVFSLKIFRPHPQWRPLIATIFGIRRSSGNGRKQ